MKYILISIIMLVTVQLCFCQTEEEILEILENYNELGEYDLTTLIEEIQDSLFELDFKKDSANKFRKYSTPVRFNLISTYWQNIEKAVGYMKSDEGPGFVGPRYGIRSRLQAGGRDFKIKAIAESDPGESDFREPDHRSAGIAVTPRREDFSLFFGDYHVEAGLGLGLATRPIFSSWKGEPHMLLKQRNRIGLHGGTDENRFLRGGAAEFQLEKLTAKVFMSGKDLDVSLKEAESGLEYFSGVYSLGLHRSETEIKKKDVVYEEGQGLIIEYLGGRYELGGLMTRFNFSRDFLLPAKETWPRSDLEYSNSGSRYSIWGRSLLGKGMIMGEYALSRNLASAFNISYSRFDRNGFTYLISYKRVEKGFFCHNTTASSSIVSKKSDSEGRINLLYRPRRRWGVQADIRMKGIENPVLENSDPRLKIRSYIYYELDNMRVENTIQLEPDKVRNSLKIKPRELDKVFYWQGEIGISSDSITKLWSDPGTYISMRGRYRTPDKTLTLQGGISLFTAGTKSIPFYTYEPDVLYGMSLPALSGTGARIFAVLQYKLLKTLTIEAKISRISYEDRNFIGSSNDRIPYDHRTSLKVQVVYRKN